MIDLMIAEDNIIEAKHLSNILATEIDFRVINISCNGLEALSSYYALKPDVLLLDLDMPGLSGLDVIENLTRTEQKENVIIVSGSGEFKNRLTDLHLVQSMMHKPIRYEYLFESIRKIKETSIIPDINESINELLLELKFDLQTKGTKYFKDAIFFAYFEPHLMDKIENLVKKVSASNFNNFKSVRSIMDKTLSNLFDNNNIENLYKFFPDFYGYKPTTKYFIKYSVSYLEKLFKDKN